MSSGASCCVPYTRDRNACYWLHFHFLTLWGLHCYGEQSACTANQHAAMLKFFCIAAVAHAYLTPSPRRRSRAVGAATDGEQWDSFTAHHVGEWFGAKTVYDASGAVVDEDSVAITCLRREGEEVTHVLKVPAAALAASGCDRCADTIEWRDIPAGSYKEGALGRFTVNGCVEINQ